MARSMLFVALAIIAGAGVLYWYTRPDTAVTNYPSHGTDVIAFGDSLVEGYGANPGKDFVSVLSQKIGQPIVNLGVAGNTTKDGIARLKQLDDYKPKVVLLLLGGNDAIRKVPPEETFANLRTIITEIHQRGAIVVLLGVRGGLVDREFPGAFDGLAEEMQTAFVPDVLNGLFGDSRYMSDAIHPNDAGYAIIADKIYSVLAPLLK